VQRYLRGAAAVCPVSWDEADVTGGGAKCVDSVAAVLSILQHASAAEASQVVHELLRLGGGAAAAAVAAWCGAHPEMPHSEALAARPYNRPISVYRFPRRAPRLCMRLSMGIQPAAAFPR